MASVFIIKQIAIYQYKDGKSRVVNMYTYKTEQKTVTKDEVLFKNGITTVDVDEGRFLQYNDYFEHKTFYQCPKCKSLNNYKNLRRLRVSTYY